MKTLAAAFGVLALVAGESDVCAVGVVSLAVHMNLEVLVTGIHLRSAAH